METSKSFFSSIIGDPDLILSVLPFLKISEWRAIKVTCKEYHSKFTSWTPQQPTIKLVSHQIIPVPERYGYGNGNNSTDSFGRDILCLRFVLPGVNVLFDENIIDQALLSDLTSDGTDSEEAQYLMEDDTTPLFYHKLGREEIRIEIEKIETNEKDFELPQYLKENDEGVETDILSALQKEGWFGWGQDDEYTRNYVRYRHTSGYNTHLSHTCESGSFTDGYNSYFFSKNITLSGKSTDIDPTRNEFFNWFAANKNKELLIGRLTFNSSFPFYGHIKVKTIQCHPFGDILVNELILNIRFPKITEDDPHYCFAGDCLIEMESGDLKYIKDVIVGDKVKTKIRTDNNDILIASATVLAKTNQLFPHSIEMVYFKDNGLCLTPGHPVFDSDGLRWKKCQDFSDRNIEIGIERNVTEIFNFVIDSRSSLIVNNCEVSSLGQYCDGVDDENSFFGTERVVDYLKTRKEWPYIDLTNDNNMNDYNEVPLCN